MSDPPPNQHPITTENMATTKSRRSRPTQTLALLLYFLATLTQCNASLECAFTFGVNSKSSHLSSTLLERVNNVMQTAERGYILEERHQAQGGDLIEVQYDCREGEFKSVLQNIVQDFYMHENEELNRIARDVADTSGQDSKGQEVTEKARVTEGDGNSGAMEEPEDNQGDQFSDVVPNDDYNTDDYNMNDDWNTEDDYQDKTQITRGTGSIWEGEADDFNPEFIPNQIFFHDLNTHFFVDPKNASTPYRYDLQLATQLNGTRNKNTFYLIDTDNYKFAALPFIIKDETNLEAITASKTEIKLRAIAKLNEGTTASVNLAVGPKSIEAKKDPRVLHTFRAVFKISVRINTKQNVEEVKPKEMLVSFARAVMIAMGDTRPSSFVVTKYFKGANHWTLDWVNNTITNPCQMFNSRKPIPPVQYLETEISDKFELEEGATFREAFTNSMLGKMKYIKSIEVLEKPNQVSCSANAPTRAETSSPKVEETTGTTTVKTTQPLVNHNMDGGTKLALVGSCGALTDDSTPHKAIFHRKYTFVLFTNDAPENATITTKNCIIKHGSSPAATVAGSSQDVSLNITETSTFLDRLVQLNDKLQEAASEDSPVALRVRQSAAADDKSINVAILLDETDVDSVKSAKATCDALKELTFLSPVTVCTTNKYLNGSVSASGRVITSTARPVVVSSTAENGTDPVGADLQEGSGGSGVLLIIIIAICIIAVLALLIGLKCYLDNKREDERESGYHKGTPSVFKNEMDVTQRKPSGVSKDDGSAQALLNTSSESKSIVQPPTYPS